VFGIGFTCGFCGHAIRPLLEYHEATGDESARQMARGIATYIARHAQTDYGAYWDNWDAAAKRGFDFIGEDYVYPHTTAKIAENMLAAGVRFEDDAVLASGMGACDWLLSLQNDDGGLPWMLVGSTGAPVGVPNEAVVMASAISAWVQACEVTDRKLYHNAARRLAEYVDERFIRQKHFAGYITDDHPGNGFNRWETPSSTAGSYAVDGLLDLYEHTKEGRWLDAALRAAHVQSLWQWLWEPDDRLQVRILGAAQQGSVWEYTLKQTLGGENLYMVWNYLRLWELTRDPFWRAAAELGLFRA
jgi:hypothetical protein